MIYKIRLSNWGDILSVGDTVNDVNDLEIKILSIVKIETDEGNINVSVFGIESSKI